MKQPLSQISNSRYHRFFRKTWYDVCLEFISWKSGASIDEIEKDTRQIDNENIGKNSQHETNRNINLSLRYEVLKRDNFRCIKCGVSPAISLGVQLHIDHIIPWSKGGETELTNLQTLCSDCNLGKSNKIDS
ncbi:HNH endonuclease [bacterium]|nr:HNH endonuclease [bacterium]